MGCVNKDSTSIDLSTILCSFPHCGCNNQPSSYSAETYVGNWYEDTVRNTIKREDFLRKRECEDLSIQRSQIMVDTLLKPVSLTAKSNGFLHYGDSIQIVAPGPDCCTAVKESPFKTLCKLSHMSLSSSVGPNEIDLKPWLDTDSIITVSPGLFPCIRNSYVIEHPECPTITSVINYGDCFRIRAMPTQQFPLYLHAAPAIKFHEATLHSAKPLVRFSDTKNPNTLWNAYPLDAKQKLRMPLGIPVPLKMRLVIKHALSGKNLSIESNFPALTYFGCEYEVSVETKHDTVRRISWENHWAFDTERGWPKEPRDFVAKAKFAASVNADAVNKDAGEEARREEEEKLAAQGYQEEMTPEECEQQQKEEMIKKAEWDAMIRKVIEEQCNPRQKKDYPDSKYPTILPREPPVCLQDIPEKQLTYAERLAEYEQAEAEQLQQQLLVDYRNKMYKDTGIPGYVMAHDPKTSPQPNSHMYTLSENQAFYPNQKWNCGDTKCCYPRGTLSKCMSTCEQNECCAEPAEPKQHFRTY
ncbi:unnamed protein product [Allacma fusca]|uniref:Uncharacterized protein n=1 Tax=Allacma fusca TaxID=39272 RepID=A0A8J2LG74_9HEXA|nr:unnamed protein product [Allacma fusca]